METLPNEILWKIFHYAGRSCWFTILVACKTWNEIGKEKFDPSIHNNKAIRYSSEKGLVYSVKYLLLDSRVNPNAMNNEAIRLASENVKGHFLVVKELLKDIRVDSRAQYNYALHYAIRNGHQKVVKELLQHSKIEPDSKQRKKKKKSHKKLSVDTCSSIQYASSI